MYMRNSRDSRHITKHTGAGLLSIVLALVSLVATHANAQVRITSCGQITESGSYVLANNLVAEAGQGCLSIRPESVTIDLAGFAIIGNGSGFGVGALGAPITQSSAVKNGTVTGFQFGLGLAGGAIVENMRVVGNRGAGILTTGDGAIIKANVVEGNGGSGMFTGGNTKISGNTVLNNGGNGIDTRPGSLVTDNVVQSNLGVGILIRADDADNAPTGSGAHISLNIVRGNGGTGIAAGRGSNISANTVQGNATQFQADLRGIDAGRGSLVSNNTVEGNDIFLSCGGSAGVFAFHNQVGPLNTARIRTVGGGCTLLQNKGIVSSVQ
jgi:hypothetical protein